MTRAGGSGAPRYGRCGRDVLPPRPGLAGGADTADSPDQIGTAAWRAGGDLIDVIQATGLRDGWTDDDVRLAQAKVRAAASRKKPPKWLHALERATVWVDAAPYPSPVADARMPRWARDLLLARVSRVPPSAGFGRRPPAGPPLGDPSRADEVPARMKRKRELGECGSDATTASSGDACEGRRPDGRVCPDPAVAALPAAGDRVKSESLTPSPVSGEDSAATGFSGEEGDDDDACLCPQ